MLFAKDRLHHGAHGRDTAGRHCAVIVARTILLVRHFHAVLMMMGILRRRSHSGSRGQHAGDGQDCQHKSGPTDHSHPARFAVQLNPVARLGSRGESSRSDFSNIARRTGFDQTPLIFW